jgi:hypothetical protein
VNYQVIKPQAECVFTPRVSCWVGTQGASPAAPPSQAAPASGLGFSPAQFVTLRAQILAFKNLKGPNQGRQLTPKELADCKPLPLLLLLLLRVVLAAGCIA